MSARRCTALLTLFTLAAVPALAGDDCAELLAAAKSAVGGAAWDRVETLRTDAELTAGGLEGTLESWEDLIRGRSVNRADLGVVTVAEGFDGATPWSQDPSGDVTEQGSERNLLVARNDAYLTARAMWYPDRWPAEIRCGETREADGRAYDVVEIVPEGGRRLELWLDAGTHRPARIVDVEAEPVSTTTFSDYREVDGLLLPHLVRSTTGEARHDTIIEVTAVAVNPEPPEDVFDIPQVAVDDFEIAGNSSSATIPFELRNNHIYVEARIDDDTTGTFLVDTGGVNLLTEAAAKRFGVQAEGTIEGRGAGEGTVDVGIARLARFTFGTVTLHEPTFYVIPLGEVQQAEGVAFDGLIGFEVFKRFVVEIDYAGRRLTLTRPEAFTDDGTGTRIPFEFDDRTPVVEGAVASVPTTFSIDTGSRSTLDLFGPFVAEHDLEAVLEPRFETLSGWGVGGGVRSKIAPPTTVRLGSLEIPGVVIAINTQTRGAFADRYTGGNIGGGLLRRFTVTFDYGRKLMILEPNADFADSEPYDRSGMWIQGRGGVFEVLDVVPGGAADAAGLEVGDRIVAVDGEPASGLGLAEVRDRFRRQPPGTVFELTIDDADGRRTTRLVLVDMLAPKRVDADS